MNLFQFFPDGIILNSGKISKWKIECDALSKEDIQTIAFMLSEKLQPFGSVIGIPTGGLKLAIAMEKYITQGPLLIVDDVLTTGNSMEQMRKEANAIGAVIFARNICPKWIIPLLTIY